VFGELHSSPHVCQQLFQLCFLQLQGVFLLDPDVFQLLQQLVPVLLDSFDVALRECSDISCYSLHSLLEGTVHAFDLSQGFLQGLHMGLGAFEELPHRVSMLVDDIAGEVVGVLPMLTHHTIPAYRAVTELTEQLQLFCRVSKT
jgi:hypothetical protein